MMASNVAVRVHEPVPEQSHLGMQWLGLLLVAMLTSLFQLFEDKEAAEERRKQMQLSMKQAFFQVPNVVAGSLASGLNGLLQYVTHFLQATGIQDGLPVNTVTPEGVVFVAQWVFLLLICYGVIALAFVLVNLFLRKLWWLLKVGVALACFGLILKDDSVDTKTMVFRLLCLGCVCILLSIRPWKDRTMAARIVQMEKQVTILENQVKGMDKWRRGCIFLSCCLIVLLCFMAFIVWRVYRIISNS